MDLQLLAALVVGVAAIVLIVLRTRLDAFVALLVAALLTGFVAGSPLTDVLDSITDGFGSTMGAIGIVIGLGVGVGKVLEVSGAADALARAFVRLLGKGREPWAMAGTGAVVSIPVFCDSGYVIMNPLARSIARRKRAGYVTLALALGCGMTLTHHLVPPTPGPLGVAGILGADVGGLILAGLAIALVLLPVVVLYARWIGPRLEAHVLPEIREEVYGTTARAATTAATPAHPVTSSGTGGAAAPDGPGSTTEDAIEGATEDATEGPAASEREPRRMSAWLAAVPLLVPLVLIVANTVATAVDRNTQGVLTGDDYTPAGYAAVLGFVGSPVVALLIGIVLAVYLLLPRATPRNQVGSWLAQAAASAGLIILITGAGGAFGKVLRDTGVGDELAETIAAWSLPGVLVPFLIATLVRLAQGSGTVAMITAASVTAPLVAGLGISPLVAAIACCAGSMVFSYFNDSYFWVVTRFTGLDGVAALRGWSGITTAAWLASLPLVLLAGAVL
ncbi:gluconate:H+ symporter, GntP family [Amycolatopsis arida]|uniref:Gluconate:H+ symporter, GntP family n=1 Tax=Amycolatopsis arida TaxID=587909 RepID=A0A1I5M2R6_9PSEU|nr:GntP family permease [Amycolatopsis arida]TDX93945.1 GntP family gluconate:H+ symporter [Amycolatopsis arida]SFP03819.1 gluconate:H+ symporter, GntP family [Amycolatopsis arida]